MIDVEALKAQIAFEGCVGKHAGWLLSLSNKSGFVSFVGFVKKRKNGKTKNMD
jgi:hypothetical protein